MSLANLARINQLKAHVTDAGEVRRLLAAARRNLADSRLAGIYSGDPIEPESVRECIHQAEALLARVQDWLRAQRPDLLDAAR